LWSNKKRWLFNEKFSQKIIEKKEKKYILKEKCLKIAWKFLLIQHNSLSSNSPILVRLYIAPTKTFYFGFFLIVGKTTRMWQSKLTWFDCFRWLVVHFISIYFYI